MTANRFRPTSRVAAAVIAVLLAGGALAACGDDGETAVFDVVGPICESSDVIGRGRTLPADTVEDDVLLVADAGAYGMAMANTYNLRALPAEEAIE